MKVLGLALLLTLLLPVYSFAWGDAGIENGPEKVNTVEDWEKKKEAKGEDNFLDEQLSSYSMFKHIYGGVSRYAHILYYQMSGGLATASSNDKSTGLFGKVFFYGTVTYLLYVSFMLMFGKVDTKQIANMIFAIFWISATWILIVKWMPYYFFWGEGGVVKTVFRVASGFISTGKVGTVAGMFEALDDGVVAVWKFTDRATGGWGLSVKGLMKVLLLFLMLWAYGTLYLQFIIAIFRNIVWLGVLSVFSPFAFMLLAFEPTRKVFISFCKKILLHSMTVWVACIIMAIIISVLKVNLAGLAEIQDSEHIFSAHYVYVIIWCLVSTTLLASAPSMAASVIGERGVSSGGAQAVAALGGALGAGVMTMAKMGGLKGGMLARKALSGAAQKYAPGAYDKYSKAKGAMHTGGKDSMGRRSWQPNYGETPASLRQQAAQKGSQGLVSKPKL